MIGTLALVVEFIPHPFQGAGTTCSMCGADDERAIHDLIVARRHGVDWQLRGERCPWCLGATEPAPRFTNRRRCLACGRVHHIGGSSDG